MSDPLAAAKLKAETAYNAAADNFDAEPLGFWARYGRRTVERLRLRRVGGAAASVEACSRTANAAADIGMHTVLSHQMGSLEAEESGQ